MTMLEASSPAPAAGCIVQQMGVGGSSDTTSLRPWPETRRVRKASKPCEQGAMQHQGLHVSLVQSTALVGMGISMVTGGKVRGTKNIFLILDTEAGTWEAGSRPNPRKVADICLQKIHTNRVMTFSISSQALEGIGSD